MSLFTDPERANLAEGYLVANTPVSLWLWLDAQPSVRRVAAFAEDEILQDLVRAVREPARTEAILAECYGLLAAFITSRRNRGVLGEPPIDLSALRWASRIWAKAKQGERSTGLILVPAPGPVALIRGV